jgi:outer membrane PBP1 activator LpoA protein
MALCSCAGAPEKEAPETPPVAQKPATPAPGSGIDIRLPPSEFSAEFASAEQALARFDWKSASVAIEPLEGQTLSMDDSSYRQYLLGRIAYLRGDQERALEDLVALEQPGINPALQYRARNVRRHALELARRHAESAQLGDLILRTAPAANRPALRRAIWWDLQRMDDREIEQAKSIASDPQWYGWLEVASIARNSAPGASENLTTWRLNNPQHPAAIDTPGGLNYLLEGEGIPLRKAAVMLPLSSRLAPAGKAVLDGYLAAYYEARATGSTALELLVLDLDRYDSALSAYQDALDQGAGLVVGPLSKSSVGELGTLVERPVPILTLNRTEQVLPASGSALVQMSLAPEDEAASIAEIAFGRGARSALILRPAGDWGNKVEGALKQRWTELGGRVATTTTYTGREDYSAAVKVGLNVNSSEKRARDIRDMLATNIEFTSRRRQDVDAVFLLSRNGPEARSIKPLLAFHYAGSIPVYAMSTIYSGIPDPRDKDLDGINLVETPWILGSNPGLRVAIAAGGTGSDSYARLNALGADAFLLQTRFRQLQAGPDVLFRGNTGFISMDPQLKLHRKLLLATFDGGTIRAQ